MAWPGASAPPPGHFPMPQASRWTSPPACPLQLVMFADHSLKSFPSVVAGLRALRARDPTLEIVLLTRGPAAGRGGACSPSLAWPACPCSAARRRSTPTTTSGSCRSRSSSDSAGVVRASSLVNHDWQLAKLRQVAAIPVEADRRGPAGAFAADGGVTYAAAGLPAQVVVLGCRAAIAVLLLAAGGAKLADLPGFASAVRLFLPGAVPTALPRAWLARRRHRTRPGAGSLSLPQPRWLEPGRAGDLLLLPGRHLVVGYARHRGRSCRCFGGLSAVAASAPPGIIQRGRCSCWPRWPPRCRFPRSRSAQPGRGSSDCWPRELCRGGGVQRGRRRRRQAKRQAGHQARVGVTMRIPLYLAIAQWVLLGALGLLVIRAVQAARAAAVRRRGGRRTWPAARRPQAAGSPTLRPGEQMPPGG